ncbi:MAG TPA: ATP-binding cassette domain-containing protein [Intrasporangiaceae bacterium]|nr:ATP-binding cassette domain-containing protein [Intrasporangiaceae bacterium]
MIRLQDVSVTYGDSLGGDLAAEPTLRDVTLDIYEGEFVLVIGPTGSGKSTLLGLLSGHVPHFTGGLVTGLVEVDRRDLREHRPRDLADVVGVVGQNPLAGFVTDTVEEELAYAMEQMGLPPAVMRKRVEETLDLLGIAELRRANLHDLSGGQQQRVAIGSVLTAHPRILVLDEPTSALDPTGAEDVLAALSRLVHDLGVTVVVAEHRIERVIHLADSIIEVLPSGQVRHGWPADIMADARVAPPIVELSRLLDWSPVPLSIRDARRTARRSTLPPDVLPAAITSQSRSYGGDGAGGRGDGTGGRLAIRATGLVVRYGEVAAVQDVSVGFDAGTVSVVMGRNGAGKSSLLWALQGSGVRTAGQVRLADGTDPADLPVSRRRRAVTLVPQSASDLLYLESVAEECRQADSESGAADGTCAGLLAAMVPGIDPDTHPRDLSEGQRLALVLAVQLTGNPAVVMLDEPTRGLDYAAKAALTTLVRSMAAAGQCVIVSTHDVEFAAGVCDRVLVMAEGEIVADGPPHEILVSSPAFAPQVSKILAPAPWLTVAQVRGALAASGAL